MLININRGQGVMGALQTAEKHIEEFFRGIPPLSKQSKHTLVKAWPLIAVIFGVIQLIVAYLLYKATRNVEVFDQLAKSLSQYYTGPDIGLSATDRIVMYLGVGLLIVDALILLMAYPHLRRRARRGWDLVFLGGLINAAYALLSAFMKGWGISPMIFGLLSSAIGFYILFQIKDNYGAHSSRTS